MKYLPLNLHYLSLNLEYNLLSTNEENMRYLAISIK